jgi:hypothetical protein
MTSSASVLSAYTFQIFDFTCPALMYFACMKKGGHVLGTVDCMRFSYRSVWSILVMRCEKNPIWWGIIVVFRGLQSSVISSSLSQLISVSLRLN